MKVLLYCEAIFPPEPFDFIFGKYGTTNDLKIRTDPEIIQFIEQWNEKNKNDPREQFGRIIEIPDELSDAWFLIEGHPDHCDGFLEIGINKNPYKLGNSEGRYYEEIGFNLDKLNDRFNDMKKEMCDMKKEIHILEECS